MSEHNTQHVVIQQQGKSMAVAYLLWFLLGWLGVHRFYLERVGSGVTQLVLFVVGVSTAIFFVGFILLLGLGAWLLVDLVLIPAIVNETNTQVGAANTGFQIGAHREDDELGRLERLYELYQKGALSKAEYETRKARLLDD